MAAALQEPFQQKVWRCIQEGLLAVRGTDILGWANRSQVFHLLDRKEARLQVVLDGFLGFLEDLFLLHRR